MISEQAASGKRALGKQAAKTQQASRRSRQARTYAERAAVRQAGLAAGKLQTRSRRADEVGKPTFQNSRSP